MVEKCVIAIGGGEIKDKTTLSIDRYIAAKCKQRAHELKKERATALFLPTASHDSLPYFNSFRKTYTSVFDIKAEVALLVKQPDLKALDQKLAIADMIYVGGGDTKFMLEVWRQTGIIDKLKDAYGRGVIICGLSAGAICWFDYAYSDCNITVSNDYTVMEGLGFLNGICCPHYDERAEFDKVAQGFSPAYAIENNAAIEFTNGAVKALGEAKAYIFGGNGNESHSATCFKREIERQ